jgi:hypothetical protein
MYGFRIFHLSRFQITLNIYTVFHDIPPPTPCPFTYFWYLLYISQKPDHAGLFGKFSDIFLCFFFNNNNILDPFEDDIELFYFHFSEK